MDIKKIYVHFFMKNGHIKLFVLIDGQKIPICPDKQ
jgi:hypothetical protein